MQKAAFIVIIKLVFFGWIVIGAPPFSGTIFLDGDIIKADELTSFIAMEPKGRGNRQMYDRRVNNWIINRAFLFEARFDDGLKIEVQVNSEYENEAEALQIAEKYLPTIGRLPNSLRKDVKTVWLHKGDKPFGGGNNNLLIHDTQGDKYIHSSILEETFVHEASHTSLDREHANAPGWLRAQELDPDFISTYARDNPTREDIAESFLLFLALDYRRDRISGQLADKITKTIPNRLEYFRDINLDLHPFIPRKVSLSSWMVDSDQENFSLTWSTLLERQYQIEESIDLILWQQVGERIQSKGMILQKTFPISPEDGVKFYRMRRIEDSQ